jgi:beta-lactamase superfamily II metal-dependent hydrolase
MTEIGEDTGGELLPQTATLTILDVGHGSCCILTDGSSTILIDTGPGAAILEYLSSEGIRRIDSVILSHADADHISGLIALLNSGEFQVDEIISNADALKNSEKWSNLAWSIDYKRRSGQLREVERLCEGDLITTNIENVRLTVLAPRLGLVLTGPGATDPKGRLISSNSVSGVLLLEVGDRHMALVTGDMDELAFEYLEDAGHDLHADVLVFPHHGGLSGANSASLERFAEALVRAVNPQDIVFSLDRRKFGNPRPEVISAVRRAAPNARIACTELSQTCSRDLTTDVPTHLLPLFAVGKARQSCCAGTMRISLAQYGQLEPARDAHRAFVEHYANSALCLRRPLVSEYPGIAAAFGAR